MSGLVGLFIVTGAVVWSFVVIMVLAFLGAALVGLAATGAEVILDAYDKNFRRAKIPRCPR